MVSEDGLKVEHLEKFGFPESRHRVVQMQVDKDLNGKDVCRRAFINTYLESFGIEGVDFLHQR